MCNLIYINDLIDLLPPDSHPTLFADDLKLFSDTSPVFTPGSQSFVASHLLQCSLDQLLLWSTLWQLPVSIPKCSILSISNSKLVRSRHYLIGNHPLPQVSTCSDLGVIIDTHLSFSHHILSIAKKPSRQSALILRCFLSRDADNLKLAFCTYVRPIVEYASPIWSPHTQNFRKTRTYLRMSNLALLNPYPNFTIYHTPPVCPVLISQLFLVAVLVLIFALSSVSCTTLPI